MAMMLGDTASITLVTGLPGSGKTLRAVKFIKEAHEAGELVFACNFNGLQLPHAEMKNPRDWRSLPPGSILVVDEAQEFFRTRRGGEAPEYITAMERIRHSGVRLLLLTQQPDYLDAHLRGLVGLHEHLVRENGQAAAKIYRHNEVMDNVRSEKGRARYDSEVWKYEPALFPLYTSAQVHTVKRRVSSRFKRGAVFAGVAALLVCLAIYRFPRLAEFGDAKAAGNGSTSAAGDGRAVHASRGSSTEIATPAEWAARFEPRIASIPASAPAFDEVAEVRDYPRAFCMSSGEDGSEGCSCMTQQGTKLNVPVRQCVFMARWGAPFDPFKEPHDAQHEATRGAGDSPALDGPARAAGAPQAARGIGSAGELQTAYGAFRDGMAGQL